jgi:hypothetical protein
MTALNGKMAFAIRAEIVTSRRRLSGAVKRITLAKKPLGRRELESFSDWKVRWPETELGFKFHRQATNKIIGISDETVAFLRQFSKRAGCEAYAPGLQRHC